ncbi:MAG: CPBP family intramembrane metalloprotease [Ruminococcaceae bacterium]|nr:CPBP family intramembrane metalloprotease [Oscillospiraceae bacterium]
MKLRSSMTAPLYAGAILLLTSFSSYMLLKVNELSENPFLSVSIIQLFVFLIPTAFYCSVGRITFSDSIKLNFSLSSIPVFIESTLVFFVGAAVMKYVGYYFLDGAYVNTPGVINASVYGAEGVLPLICMVFLPAILEEIVFRGVLLEEYKAYGDITAVVMTSLFFAMIHFSLENFLYYFFAGIVFGLMTVATNSCIPAIALHIINNFTALTVEDSYITYIDQLGGTMLFLFIGASVFLLLLFFLFSRIEGLYMKKAEMNSAGKRLAIVNEAMMLNEGKAKKNSDLYMHVKGEADTSHRNGEPHFKDTFLSPSFWIVVVFFMLKASDVI